MFNHRSTITSDPFVFLSLERDECCDQHPPALTDLGNARRFASRFATIARYVPTRGWFLFSQTHWQPATNDIMLSLARESLDDLLEQVKQLSEEENTLGERILTHLARCGSLVRLQALLRIARTLPAMRLSPSKLDADPYLLNLRNGTLDLRSGSLLPHKHEHYLTRLLPYDYTPEATASIWEDFLDRLTVSDPELKRYLQRAVGVTLFGNSSESTCFVLTGPGQRAQQLFLSTLRQLLGSYASHTLSLKERTLTPTLLNSRLLTSASSPLVRTFDPSILSAFVNLEPLSIIKDSIELIYQPRATLWLSTTELPQLSEEFAFLREYLQPIPLSLSLSSYEAAQLSTQLQDALPAILNWAIEGFQLWYTEAPSEPTCIQEAAATFQEDQEPLTRFFAQACTAEPEQEVSATTLYQAYRTWARTSGERLIPASRFSTRALASGLRRSRQDTGDCYQNLKLIVPTTVSSP